MVPYVLGRKTGNRQPDLLERLPSDTQTSLCADLDSKNKTASHRGNCTSGQKIILNRIK